MDWAESMTDEQEIPVALVRIRNVINGGFANVDEDLADALYPAWERTEGGEPTPRRRGRPRKNTSDNVSGDADVSTGTTTDSTN